MRGLPASSPAIRIRQGETVVAQAWSNTATQLWGYFRVVYDDGTDDAFTLDRLLLLNNRVQGNLTSKSVAKEDGYIVSGQICQVSGVANQATQRGQCYVRAFVVNDAFSAEALSAGGCRAMLCMGYIYSGVDVALGMMVEPGPAGGPGQRVVGAGVDPAAGSDIADITVPTGAIWRIESYSVQLVQGITQTPLPTLRFRNAALALMAQIPITTTAISASSTAQLTWARGVAQTSFIAVVGDEFHTAPLPLFDLIAGDLFGTITDGIGANTNYGLVQVTFEDWVVPN